MRWTAVDGRDAGKVFEIEMMRAYQAERWAVRAFLAAGRAGIEIPDNIQELGQAGLFMVGLQALGKIDFAEAEHLLAEMLSCVKRVEASVIRPLVENDTEEVQTLFKLRAAWWELHAGFFGLGGPLTSASGPQEAPGPSLSIKPRRAPSPP